MQTLEILRGSKLLSHLNDRQLECLSGLSALRRVAAGESLFPTDDGSFDVYLVARGALRVCLPTTAGLFELAELRPGELFGEINFIDRLGRSGEIRCTSAADLLVFDSADLRVQADLDPAFELAVYWCFWKSLSAKLRRTNLLLSRFFSPDRHAGGYPPEPEAAGPVRQVHLDIAAKRGLFEEQKLSAMEINFLASLSREEAFGPGEMIFREGEPGRRMYVVLDGKVMISKNIPGAGEEALSFLERGDYFGEMALIDKEARSADAKAHQEQGAVVLSVPAEVVEGILDIQKVSSIRLLKLLCQMVCGRLRNLNAKLTGWYLLAGGDLPGGGDSTSLPAL